MICFTLLLKFQYGLSTVPLLINHRDQYNQLITFYIK